MIFQFFMVLLLPFALIPSHGRIISQTLFLIRSGSSEIVKTPSSGDFGEIREVIQEGVARVIASISKGLSLLKVEKLPDGFPVPALVTVGYIIFSKLTSVAPNSLESRNRELHKLLHKIDADAKNNITSLTTELELMQQKSQKASKAASDSHRELKLIKSKYVELEQDARSTHSSLAEELQLLRQSYQKSVETASELSYELELTRNQYFELQQEARSAQSRTQAAHGQLNQALNSLQSLETQSEFRDSELANKDNQIFDLLASSHQLELECLRIKSTAEKQGRAIEARDQDIKSLQTRIEELECSYSENEVQMNSLRKQVVGKEKNISQLKYLLSEAKDVTVKLQQEVRLAQSQTETTNEELLQALSSLQILEADAELKDTELANRERQIFDLLTSSQHADVEYSKLKSNVERQRRDIEAKEQDIQSLQTYIQELESISTENEAHLNALIEALSEKERHISELQNLLSEAQATTAELSSLKTAHLALTEQFYSINSSFEDLSVEYTNFQSASNTAAAELRREIQKYQTALATSDRETIQAGETLKAELQAVSSQLQLLKSSYAALQAESTAKEQASVVHRERISQIEAEAATLKSTCDRYAKEISARDRTANHLQAQLNGLSDEYASFKSATKLAAAELRREIQMHLRALKAAEASLATSGRETIQARETLKAELETVSSQLNTLKGSYAALQADSQAKEKVSAVLRERISQIEAEAATLKATCESQEEVIAVRDLAIKDLRAKVESFREEGRIVKELKEIARLASALKQ